MEPLLSVPGHRSVWIIAALAASAAVVLLLPDSGILAWVAFGFAGLGVAAALAIMPDSVEYGAAALFATIAIKDAVLVVKSVSVGVFHVVALALALVWIARGLKRRARGLAFRLPRLTALEWTLAGPAIAGAWSIATSLHTTKSVLYTGRLLLLWAIVVVVARSLGREQARHRALVWFVGGSTFIALVGLAQWLGLDVGNGIVQGNSYDLTLLIRPAAFYLDPNFLGTHLVLGITGALALAFRRGRAWWWLAAVAPMLAAVAATYSRTTWLTLAVGLLACIVLGPRELRLKLVAVVAVAVIIGSLVLGPHRLLARVGSVFDLSGGSSSATRLLMAEASVEMIRDRPIFGTGLEAFTEAYSAYRKPGALVDVSHPHQVPLALIAETGVAGLLAQVLLLTGLLGAVRIRMRTGLTDVDVAVVAGLLVLLVTTLLQFVLYFEPMWLMAGLLAAGVVAARRETGVVPSS